MTVMAAHFSTATGAQPTLDVVAGVHRGVTLAMQEPICVIGAGHDDDLVLSDAGIAARHVRLRFTAQHVSLEALGGDIQVTAAGRTTAIARGHGYRAALPLSLQLGDATLMLLAPLDDVRAHAPVWYSKTQWVMAGAFMCICAGAVAMFNDAPEADPMAFINNLPATATGISNPAPSLDSARADLAKRASSAKLKDLKIVAANGQLKASGSLTPDQRPEWVALQQYFDSHYGRHFVLHSNDVAVRAPGAQPKVHFQAVWFGENPYVIDSTGTRLVAGAPLTDGWVIKDIKNEMVELARGDENFYFTLPAAPADDS